MDTLNKIKQLLKENRLNQKDLTDYLCINKNAFTNWSNGSNKSYIKHLPQIAEFFDVSVDYLLGKEHSNNIIAYNGENVLKQEIVKSIKNILENIEDDKKLSQIKMFLDTYIK